METISLGAALRGSRKSRGLTGQAASQAIAVSLATLKRWESDQGVPSRSALIEILTAWGVPEGSPWRQLIEKEAPSNSRSWSVDEPHERVVLRLLRSKRRRNFLTLQEVSSATGLPVASIYRYEQGTRTPNQDVLAGLSAAVGCSNLEQDLLSKALTHPDDLNLPEPVFYAMGKPNSTGQFWVFFELDRILCERNNTSPSPAYLASLFQSLVNTGDHQSLVEIWPIVRDRLPKASLVGLNRINLGSLVTLAQMNLTKEPRALHSRFARWGEEIESFRDHPYIFGTMFTLTRMAEILGDVSAASWYLGQIQNQIEMLGSGMLAFFCDVHSTIIEFESKPSTRPLDALATLETNATHPVENYTLEVARLSMLHRLGMASSCKDALGRCRIMEHTFGYGSPLANQISARLAV